MRIAPLLGERWVVKAAGWNLELSSKCKTYRAIGRPKREWEDEIGEFLNPEETETTTGNDMGITTHGSSAKIRERWTTLESEYAKTAEERSADNVLRRETLPQDPIRPARYLNGVKLEDDEVANIM